VASEKSCLINCPFLLDHLNPRVATTRREQKVPTMEQIKHVFNAMPADIDIERRNQALVAFTLLTGARTVPLPR